MSEAPGGERGAVGLSQRRERPDRLSRLRAAVVRWRLTKREGQVLDTLSLGMSNKDLALTLGCARKTIEIHVSAILRKAGVGTRAALVAAVWMGA